MTDAVPVRHDLGDQLAPPVHPGQRPQGGHGGPGIGTNLMAQLSGWVSGLVLTRVVISSSANSCSPGAVVFSDCTFDREIPPRYSSSAAAEIPRASASSSLLGPGRAPP
jgi:hypothetical protein